LTSERLLSLPQDMNDDMRVVFESRNRRACADRALVLASLQIPHDIVEDALSCALIVPAAFSAQASQQLWLYDEENPPAKRAPKPVINYQNPVPGVIGYVVVVCAFAWFADASSFGQDWRGAGRVDGVLIRNGEWWRTITALTLHADLRHIVGNIVFGALFGLFAGRLLGSGVAWLAILLAAAAGNALNTLLLESAHRSIGASTAVFAALGIVAGFVWRGKFMSQERWPYRIGPVVGGFALLMFTGTGDANTDIGAHLMGFLCGFTGGMLLTMARDKLTEKSWQRAGAILASLIIVGAWSAAFLS